VDQIDIHGLVVEDVYSVVLNIGIDQSGKITVEKAGRKR